MSRVPCSQSSVIPPHTLLISQALLCIMGICAFYVILCFHFVYHSVCHCVLCTYFCIIVKIKVYTIQYLASLWDTHCMTYESAVQCSICSVCVCAIWSASFYVYYHVYCATPCITLHAEDDDGRALDSHRGPTLFMRLSDPSSKLQWIMSHKCVHKETVWVVE